MQCLCGSFLPTNDMECGPSTGSSAVRPPSDVAPPAGVPGAAALLVVHAERHEAGVGRLARDGGRARHVRRRVREPEFRF